MKLISSTYSQFKRPLYRYAIGSIAVFVTISLIILFRALSSPNGKALISHIPGVSTPDSIDDIYNVTLGFERVYAINLPERTDHRDAISLACAVSNIRLDFVDGVYGDAISEQAIPPGKPESMKLLTMGSWRAHMNAITKLVVHDNITSALIMEDDVDWDVCIRPLLANFASSLKALLHSPASKLDFRDISKSTPDLTSPFGDGWDVLWLGHCGMSISEKDAEEGIVVQSNNPSVPEPHYLRSWEKDKPSPLRIYPNHTRVVVHEQAGVCSLAYAISQSGARKLLYNLGLRRLDAPFDIMLRSFCGGTDDKDKHVCISVVPQLFEHHRSVGSLSHDSDINNDSEFRAKAVTKNIRWSMRMNMERILGGETDYEDQYPDTA